MHVIDTLVTGARKRASGRQLTDRDDVDDGVAEVDSVSIFSFPFTPKCDYLFQLINFFFQGVFQQADEGVLKERKYVVLGSICRYLLLHRMVKVRRGASAQAEVRHA